MLSADTGKALTSRWYSFIFGIYAAIFVCFVLVLCLYHYKIIGMNQSTNLNLKESENVFTFNHTIPRSCCAKYFTYFHHLGTVLFGKVKDTLIPNDLMRESRRLMNH